MQRYIPNYFKASDSEFNDISAMLPNAEAFSLTDSATLDHIRDTQTHRVISESI